MGKNVRDRPGRRVAVYLLGVRSPWLADELLPLAQDDELDVAAQLGVDAERPLAEAVLVQRPGQGEEVAVGQRHRLARGLRAPGWGQPAFEAVAVEADGNVLFPGTRPAGP